LVDDLRKVKKVTKVPLTMYRFNKLHYLSLLSKLTQFWGKTFINLEIFVNRMLVMLQKYLKEVFLQRITPIQNKCLGLRRTCTL
jgi:hypothetical protein